MAVSAWIRRLELVGTLRKNCSELQTCFLSSAGQHYDVFAMQLRARPPLAPTTASKQTIETQHVPSPLLEPFSRIQFKPCCGRNVKNAICKHAIHLALQLLGGAARQYLTERCINWKQQRNSTPRVGVKQRPSVAKTDAPKETHASRKL